MKLTYLPSDLGGLNMNRLVLVMLILPGVMLAGAIKNININREAGNSLESLAKFQCEYYKNQASTFCRSNYSDYDERQDCSKVYKERWCRCMDYNPDCYKKEPFYW
ncbi:MAG: hypothetical protein KBD64_06010 [Gammaproteobacteria bacterium]|nr:hypothetical protein [Gammaproteobacteria bacterium]